MSGAMNSKQPASLIGELLYSSTPIPACMALERPESAFAMVILRLINTLE